jgi:hypothetical protein
MPSTASAAAFLASYSLSSDAAAWQHRTQPHSVS